MVLKLDCVYVIGILCFILLLRFDCLAYSVFHNNKRSIDNDNHNNRSTTSPNNDVIPQPTTAPPWLKQLLDGSWYGSVEYMQRELYLKNPNRKPTICFSNVTKDENGTLLNSFICPMSDQKDDKKYCCGVLFNQHCCTLKERAGDADDDDIPLIQDIDIVTGISIAVGFVLSVTICMSLYCCCCQRRPEIHDGIKLMWVRRSFGKELNRLEEPMYQNQLTVGGRGSKNPSRSGSQQHSRSGSRNPSRNASRDCSPSVSRRGSHQAYNKLKDDEKSKLKVPGGVTITLTTPSDEQGPTNPLLKQTQEHIEST